MAIESNLKLGLVVHCPSPHQKPLLDSLCRVSGVDTLIAYAYPDSPNRNWGIARAEGRTVNVPRLFSLVAPGSLRAWLQQYDRNLWILGSSFTYARTQLLANAFESLDIPWIFLGEPPRPRSGLFGRARDLLVTRLLASCDGVIATGVESARRYRVLAREGMPVTSVPYYIALEEWCTLPLVTAPSEGQPTHFVTLAQLIERKGLDVLIESCLRLPPSGWILNVYGDGPERIRLQRMIDRHRLPVTLHKPLPFAERMNAFRGTHCFVFPSRWDGWGMAPVEALAAGRPVIASEATMSAHDFIRPDVNGWIVPCRAEAFAAAMRAVMEHPDRLAPMSLAARDSVADYRPESGAAELVRFSREVLNSNPRGGAQGDARR